MARKIYCHPTQTRFDYHIYTDLDFWDARRLLRDLALVKRNFGETLSGDEFPTQVVGDGLSRQCIKQIEHRLGKAIVSPARHVIVRTMVFEGEFEFDPLKYYPKHWTKSLILHFTYHRLPLAQGVLNNPYQTVELSMVGGKVRVRRVQRHSKHDPVIQTKREALRHFAVPSCF